MYSILTLSGARAPDIILKKSCRFLFFSLYDAFGENKNKKLSLSFFLFFFLLLLCGWRLKGKGKGVLGARETRGAREEGGKETPDRTRRMLNPYW